MNVTASMTHAEGTIYTRPAASTVQREVRVTGQDSSLRTFHHDAK